VFQGQRNSNNENCKRWSLRGSCCGLVFVREEIWALQVSVQLGFRSDKLEGWLVGLVHSKCGSDSSGRSVCDAVVRSSQVKVGSLVE
jgi:hypothetical protein